MHLNYKKVYFSGIGGIGVSALAKMFYGEGVKVLGSDLARSDITDDLERLGATIHYKQIKKNIDELYGEEQTNTRFYYYGGQNREKGSDAVKAIAYPTAGKVTVIASPENIEKISKQLQKNLQRQLKKLCNYQPILFQHSQNQVQVH